MIENDVLISIGAAFPRAGGRCLLGAVATIVILYKNTSFLHDRVSVMESRCVPAERAGFVLWCRVAAKQVRLAEGFIRQWVLPEVLPGHLDLHGCWVEGGELGLGFDGDGLQDGDGPCGGQIGVEGIALWFWTQGAVMFPSTPGLDV